jgi:alkylation response protein AidB-like acyl-CoA dehydrogenase
MTTPAVGRAPDRGLFGRALFEDDHEAYRDVARRYLDAEVAPRLETWRQAGGAPPAAFAEVGGHGLLGMSVPERVSQGFARYRPDLESRSVMPTVSRVARLA